MATDPRQRGAAAGAAADFLHGHSPPKKGPLSTIDEGGANVTKAWAKGLASGIGYVHRAVGTLASVPMPGLAGGGVRDWQPAEPPAAGAGLTINGGLHLHGVGSDVSPAAAQRFGQQVLREVAAGFRTGRRSPRLQRGGAAMSRPTLGDLELMELSYVGFDHPQRAQVVPLLSADTTVSGNAVLQSGALGFRQAQITWLADGQDDVDTARATTRSCPSRRTPTTPASTTPSG
jgi:hypothetical protein